MKLSQSTDAQLRARRAELYDRTEALLQTVRAENRTRLTPLETLEFDTLMGLRDNLDSELRDRQRIERLRAAAEARRNPAPATADAAERRRLSDALRRSPACREEAKRAAYHEAGHAVAQMLEGQSLRYVALEAAWGAGGRLRGIGGRALGSGGVNAGIHLAGYAAECIRFGSAPRWPSEVDFRRAREALGGIDGRQAARTVEGALRAVWPAVEALAKALEERIYLDGAEAERIVTERFRFLGFRGIGSAKLRAALQTA
jgi:hypothetical protein